MLIVRTEKSQRVFDYASHVVDNMRDMLPVYTGMQSDYSGNPIVKDDIVNHRAFYIPDESLPAEYAHIYSNMVLPDIRAGGGQTPCQLGDRHIPLWDFEHNGTYLGKLGPYHGWPASGRLIPRSRAGWEHHAKITSLMGNGTCQELATMAAFEFLYLMQSLSELSHITRIELVQSKVTCFAVINRIEKDINSLHLWGDDAIILAVWEFNAHRRFPFPMRGGCVWATDANNDFMDSILDLNYFEGRKFRDRLKVIAIIYDGDLNCSNTASW
ncbi:MAG: hypothetical protein KAH18_09805 [Psychromonas sp.]|nr:hypothetical protein [Psychromonas sp.]